MRKYGNEEKLGGRKPVELVLQLHVVVVVDLTLKFPRRLCALEVCPSIVLSD